MDRVDSAIQAIAEAGRRWKSVGYTVGHNADVAQLVEHHLAKVRVAGSSPVVRSKGLFAKLS